MRIPYLPTLIMLLFMLGSDAYIYYVMRRRIVSRKPSLIYLCGSTLLYVVLAVILCIPFREGGNSQLLVVMWTLFTLLTVYLPKMLFVVIDLLASIPQMFGRRRIKWLSLTGLALSGILFLGMWWGALVNRFNTQVNEETIVVDNLPDSFDGFRIIQISDLHVGTFQNDTAFVSHLVDEINSLSPDVIVFTGDIVNRRTDEFKPFVKVMSRLKAPCGVYSILGNHDYGDYADWESEQAKAENQSLMQRFQQEAGMRLLLNENDKIVRGNDTIVMIGVENIGDPPFKVYGSLEKAYPDLADDKVKVLLTHNPVHWKTDVADNDSANVALTLSGHTHAMQIELLGLSPAWFRYDTWGGLYRDSKGRHPLYVNIGAGTVGFPMRLGATPEITVITLKKAR